MIQIQSPADCCGCGACAQRCPQHCITLQPDTEGFLYPSVDTSRCTNCGLCNRVCPVLHPAAEREPIACYAAWNKDDEVRRTSSSGGVFSLLAQQTIAKGGVVFGVGFSPNWTVEHQAAETLEQAAAFRGSKYVQSHTRSTFLHAEQALKAGRPVLFSGTPCQIAALHLFLRKPYDNLTTVDLICHGTPSPGVFRTFLQEAMHKAARQRGGKNTVSSPPIPPFSEGDGPIPAPEGMAIESIAFRDKRNGWKKYSFALLLSKASAAGEKNSVSLSYTLDKHPFLRGFLADLYLRPSCHQCPAKSLRSQSDITLADFWGVQSVIADIDDDRGISAILANTPRGVQLLQESGAHLIPVSLQDITKGNSALFRSAPIPPRREEFFTPTGKDFHTKVAQLCKKSLAQRVMFRFRATASQILRATGLMPLARKLLKRQ